MDIKTVKILNILRAKCVVIGDSQVGKTSLCQQLSSDGTNFPKNYLLTQCCDVLVKTINIPDTNECVEMYLMDSSGKEMYHEMMAQCWKNAALLVIMYDVTSEETLTAAEKWHDQASKALKAASSDEKKPLTGVLVANKTDLTDRRTVSPKAGNEMAQKLGLMYFECSCKDFSGVEEPFYYLANEFHKQHADAAEDMAQIAA